MGIIRKALGASVLGLSAGAAYLTTTTTLVTPLAGDDALLRSPLLRELNRFQNPIMTDLVVKRIPLSKIRPELRDDEAALSIEFNRVVWSGWAHTPQRVILTQKHKGPETADQLFTREELARSRYELGTQFVDHFEVVSRTRDEVVVRAGDSPRQKADRDLDGLLALRARIDREAGEVELSFATVFFKGKEKDASPPVPPPVEYLHQLYARALLLNGAQGLQ
ncbi:hypothetical protein BX600DRAFT_256092 [Xylariales sp. PMI_506]|nr:hypothetical protein BX600DRAFT_256092 [Xylariales sp. PMI_506]